MLRCLARFGFERRGASLIEFTMVAPVLLILGLGTLEFGSALYAHHVVSTGVHDAARYLARLDDPLAAAASGKQLAVTGEVSGTAKRLSWWAAANVSVSVANIANPIDGGTGERTYRGPDPIKVVRVSTTAIYPGFGVLSFLGLGSALTFSVYHEERAINE